MLLDSAFLVDLDAERQRGPGAATRFLEAHRGERAHVSVVAAAEFAAGCRNIEAARRFLAQFLIVPINFELALLAASLDRRQRKAGRPLGENDTWIAATALRLRRPLVTSDRAFPGIPGLKLLLV